MKKIADVHFCWKKDVDLLLVDFGDLHDGSSLSNGFPPVFPYPLPHRVQSLGLTARSSFSPNCPMTCSPSEKLMNVTRIQPRALHLRKCARHAPEFCPQVPRPVPLNITILGPNGSPVSVPVGSRFAKFKTRKGRKVTSLGVPYSFTETITIKGGRHGEGSLGPLVFSAVRDDADSDSRRAHAPRLPEASEACALFVCSLMRYSLQFDGRSIALEKQAVHGNPWWLVILSVARGSDRVYLWAWISTIEVASGTSHRDSSFDTSIGRKITKGLEALAARFDLDFKFGLTPRDYTLSRDPFPSKMTRC
ncbi:hypothetical protein EDB84DRAFT_1678269 [Lactarius hengduanensis]|nr:hypothetical protein EDB84DRAFT_1678269 [Lactarius hengduanensis]